MQAVVRFSCRQPWPRKLEQGSEARHLSSGVSGVRSLSTEKARAVAPRPAEESSSSLFRFLHLRRKKREAVYVLLTGFRLSAGIV